jgi:hypothetical protein
MESWIEEIPGESGEERHWVYCRHFSSKMEVGNKARERIHESLPEDSFGRFFKKVLCRAALFPSAFYENGFLRGGSSRG